MNHDSIDSINCGGGLNSKADEVNNNNDHENMMDMRRQLDYLQVSFCHGFACHLTVKLTKSLHSQSQIDERDRTIRIQKNLITKYETEKQSQMTNSQIASKSQKLAQQTTIATQTERVKREPVYQSIKQLHSIIFFFYCRFGQRLRAESMDSIGENSCKCSPLFLSLWFPLLKQR